MPKVASLDRPISGLDPAHGHALHRTMLGPMELDGAATTPVSVRLDKDMDVILIPHSKCKVSRRLSSDSVNIVSHVSLLLIYTAHGEGGGRG